MRVNVNLNPTARIPKASPQDLMMIGRPGRPLMMQRFVRNRLSGLGAGACNPAQNGQFPNCAPNGTCTGMTVADGNGNCVCPGGGINTQVGACTVNTSCPSGQQWSDANQQCVGTPAGYTSSNPCPTGLTYQNGACVNPVTNQNEGTPAQIAATMASQASTTNALISGAIPQPVNVVSGGGSGTQGGGGAVMGVVPVGNVAQLSSQTTVPASNMVGTSGQATTDLVNGLPAAGSNANEELTTSSTNLMPLLLVAGVAVLFLMEAKK